MVIAKTTAATRTAKAAAPPPSPQALARQRALQATPTRKAPPPNHEGLWYNQTRLPKLGPGEWWKLTTVKRVATDPRWAYSWKFNNPFRARAAINALIADGNGNLAKIEVKGAPPSIYLKMANPTDVLAYIRRDEAKAKRR